MSLLGGLVDGMPSGCAFCNHKGGPITYQALTYGHCMSDAVPTEGKLFCSLILVVLKTTFDLCLGHPFPRGVPGRVRTVICLSKSWFRVGSIPDPGVLMFLNFDFGFKCS